MKIIGLGITAQVGKDTAAAYLEKKFPGQVKPLAFAYKLKKIAMELFGLSWEQCNGPYEIKEAIDPRYGKSPRKIMQELGEKMREIYPDVWIDAVFDIAIPKFQKDGYDIFAISDTRYPNEAVGIQGRSGVVVRIDREDSGVRAGKNHSSETALKNYDKFDFIIENNGTLEEFYDKLDSMLEEIDYGGTSR